MNNLLLTCKFIVAIINLRGVSTKLNKYIALAMQMYNELINLKVVSSSSYIWFIKLTA